MPIQVNMTSQPDLVTMVTPKNDTTSQSIGDEKAAPEADLDSIVEPTTPSSPKMNAASPQKLAGPASTTKVNRASEVNPIEKVASKKNKNSRWTTVLGWKRWARQQKKPVYNEDSFVKTNKELDAYISAVKWDEETKKLVEISQQQPYRDFMNNWDSTKKRLSVPSAIMLEAIRLMNDLVVPADISDLLAESGWDATKCCNPKLEAEEKKLKIEPMDPRRNTEAEKDQSPPMKKVKMSTPLPHLQPPRLSTPVPKFSTAQTQPSPGRYSREIPPALGPEITKTGESNPVTVTHRPEEGSQDFHIPSKRAGDGNSLPNISHRGGLEIDAAPRFPNTGAAVYNIQPAKTTASPNSTGSLYHKASSKRIKRVTRKRLRRTSHQLGEQSGRLHGHADRLDEHQSRLQEHSGQLAGFSDQSQKQELAIEQLRLENRHLRRCLRDILLPLTQAVNAVSKSQRADRKTLKAAERRAREELRELKAARKTSKVLKRRLKQMDRDMPAVNA
ncbi:hypothetical protein EsH8_VIII_000846 [Colletotrichum jinshuiense]